MRLVVVIPCLNEEASIGGVLRRIPTAIPGVREITTVVVDDGCTDATARIAVEHGAVVVSHGQNLGYGSAFRTALEYALSVGADLMVHMDGDGQFAPEDIRTLVAPIVEKRADLVLGSRFADPALVPEMPRAKYYGNIAMSWLLSRLLRRRFHDVSCGFRAYSSEALLHLDLKGTFTHSQETVLDLAYKGLRILEIPVQVRYFPGRVSRIADSLPRYAVRTLSIIARAYRDYYPLRFFNSIAALLIGTGALFGLRLFRHYQVNHQFYGEIWAGAIGGFLMAMGTLAFITGLLTHLIDRNRILHERILYILKRDARERRALGVEPEPAPPMRFAASHRRHTPPMLRVITDLDVSSH